MDKNRVYISMVLSSALVLIFAPVITAVICKLGTSFTMIFGTLCISAFYPTLLYPNCFTVYIGVPINAIGFAFLRAGSVAILTDDVAKGSVNSGRNGVIQCVLFMFSIVFGNLIVFFITSTTFNDNHETRIVIAAVLFATNVIGAALFCTTKLTKPETQLMRAEGVPIIIQNSNKTSTFSQLRRTSFDLLSDCKELLLTYSTQFKIIITPFYRKNTEECPILPTISNTKAFNTKVFKASPTLIVFLKKGQHFLPTGILNMDTMAFIIPMIASACYCMAYCVIFPGQAGIVIGWSFVPVFGIFVGTGEAIGYVVARHLTINLGVKCTTIIANILGLGCFIGAGLLFPLGYMEHLFPVVQVGPTPILILGFFIGISDVTFNYCLSTLVRRVYAESFQTGYAFYGCMLNLCCIAIAMFADVYCLFFVLILFTITACLGTLCLFYLQRRVEEILRRDLTKGYLIV